VGLGTEEENPQEKKLPPTLYLYPVDDESGKSIPDGRPIKLNGKTIKDNTNKKGWYDYKFCAWTFNSASVHEFVTPAAEALRPGRYKVSRYDPVGMGRVKAEVNERLTSLSPASVGARVEGSLPTLEVLSP
jgi:hypothetical protein